MKRKDSKKVQSNNVFHCLNIAQTQTTSRSQIIDNIVQSIRNRNTVFFFGAGASAEYPSCLPTADRLRGYLRHMIIDLVKMDLIQEELRELEGLGLEVLLDYFSSTLGVRALEFYDILKSKTCTSFHPNFRHYFLALLAHHGYCRNYITLNFDTAIEEAFTELEIPYIVPENNGAGEKDFYVRFSSDKKHNSICIFKLHGTLNDKTDPYNSNLLATVERVGIGLPKYKRKVLESLASHSNFFFLGYGHKYTDIDVFPVIAKVKSNTNVFWHIHSNNRNAINDISDEIREFLKHKNANIIITENITSFLADVLNALAIDFTIVLKKMHIGQLDEIKHREKELHKIRQKEKDIFLKNYVRKHFTSSAPAYLILANIMQKPGLWYRADALFDRCKLSLPKCNYALQYVYYSKIAENYRNSGQLAKAITSRKVAMRYLDNSSNTTPSIKSSRIHLLIRNGSDCMGHFESYVRSFITELKPFYIAAAGLRLLEAISCFASAYHTLSSSRKILDDFENGTYNSMFYFEIADFFQTVMEGILYLGLVLRLALRQSLSTIIPAVRLAASIAECFYRRSVDNEPTQSSGWFIFQKQRLAEVIMHRVGCVEEVNDLIKDASNYYAWGRPRLPSEKTDLNLCLCKGTKLFYRRRYRQALDFLEKCYDEYEREKHYSGMFKTKLIQGLCADKIANTDDLKDILKDMRRITGKYE